MEGKLVIAVNKYSPLAVKKTVTPQELTDQHFVLYHDEFVESLVNQLSLACGPVPILFRTNNTNAISAALKQQMAITIDMIIPFYSTY